MDWNKLEERLKGLSEEEVDRELEKIEKEEDERLAELEKQAEPIITEFCKEHPVSISNPGLIDDNTLGYYIWGYGGFIAWKSEVSKLKENLQKVPELLRENH